MPDPVTDAETRITNALSGADDDARFRCEDEWLCADDLCTLLASLATLREGMRLLNEEIDTVGNERDALRAENARLRERDAQPARLSGTSN